MKVFRASNGLVCCWDYRNGNRAYSCPCWRGTITPDDQATFFPKNPQGFLCFRNRRPSFRTCLWHADVRNLPTGGAVPPLAAPSSSRHLLILSEMFAHLHHPFCALRNRHGAKRIANCVGVTQQMMMVGSGATSKVWSMCSTSPMKCTVFTVEHIVPIF